MSDNQFVIGIDLGTTNTALAQTPFKEIADPTERPVISSFAVTQVVQQGETAENVLLPSFLYLPQSGEVPAGSLALPWDAKRDQAAGLYARSLGSKIPGRIVSSAKSWLCHSGVDRHAAILPWQPPATPGGTVPASTRLISPVEASSKYLQHLKESWNHSQGKKGPKLEDQEIVLTVPASFDAVARQLTVEAAQSAGLTQLTLLEEPQAAFYSWIETHQENWRELVHVGDVILVCDIGGGTSDLSLISVTEEKGKLALNRMAVGDHILLGGDNMDLALAHHLQEKLKAKGSKLDNSQFIALTHSCRTAKENLLSDAKLSPQTVTVLGKGSKLVGGTLTVELTKEDIQQVILEGFFPLVPAQAEIQKGMAFGLQEIGLPYSHDPVITRHLAQFLRNHADALKAHYQKAGQPVRTMPTAVLCNGGVFKARLFEQRIMEQLNQWAKEAKSTPLRLLEGTDLDQAVARGAAYYGLVQKGKGVRIRGGIAMTYYIGIETARPAVPGRPAPIRALCVAPMGMEEGTTEAVPGLEFGLVVGEPVRFRFLGSNLRRDALGTLVDDWEETIQELSPIETALKADTGKKGTTATGSIPVKLETTVTSIGTLELWCVSRDGKQRWKLEFNVRQQPGKQ
ncbi:MAG: Hsp70 family protein [Planctomycetia bacterium]|nr:Hsp70 family protein [Planctomycetia bacterium]